MIYKSINRNKDVFIQRKERFMSVLSKGELTGISNSDLAIRFNVGYMTVSKWKTEYKNKSKEGNHV